MVVGNYDGHVIFDEFDCPSRTNQSFRLQSDLSHHRGISPLLQLPIDMVKDLPLDYLHLVCLGVMKRLLMTWLAGPLKNRFSSKIVSLISDRILKMRHVFPSDFNRKPRSLNDIKYWKATEFRTFLLYSGVVALQGIIPKNVYTTFCSLHAAIYMLCDPDHYRNHLPKAHAFIMLFVNLCKDMYGSKFISFNVHNLIHLSGDCERFGNLETFSAFKFENKMRHIRKLLRSTNLPLEQLVNRLEEKGRCQTQSTYFEKKYSVRMEHCDGPLYDVNFQKQYKIILVDNIRFSVNEKDGYFFSSGRFYKIVNILQNNDDIFFLCQKFKNMSRFYNFPCDSSLPGIYCISNLSCKLYLKAMNQVYRKCIVFPYKNIHVAFPLFVKWT